MPDRILTAEETTGYQAAASTYLDEIERCARASYGADFDEMSPARQRLLVVGLAAQLLGMRTSHPGLGESDAFAVSFKGLGMGVGGIAGRLPIIERLSALSMMSEGVASGMEGSEEAQARREAN